MYEPNAWIWNGKKIIGRADAQGNFGQGKKESRPIAEIIADAKNEAKNDFNDIKSSPAIPSMDELKLRAKPFGIKVVGVKKEIAFEQILKAEAVLALKGGAQE